MTTWKKGRRWMLLLLALVVLNACQGPLLLKNVQRVKTASELAQFAQDFLEEAFFQTAAPKHAFSCAPSVENYLKAMGDGKNQNYVMTGFRVRDCYKQGDYYMLLVDSEMSGKQPDTRGFSLRQRLLFRAEGQALRVEAVISKDEASALRYENSLGQEEREAFVARREKRGLISDAVKTQWLTQPTVYSFYQAMTLFTDHDEEVNALLLEVMRHHGHQPGKIDLRLMRDERVPEQK